MIRSSPSGVPSMERHGAQAPKDHHRRRPQRPGACAGSRCEDGLGHAASGRCRRVRQHLRYLHRQCAALSVSDDGRLCKPPSRECHGEGRALRPSCHERPDLIAADDIDLVLNLTIPAAHAEISLAAIAAGKHVYTEKPLAVSVVDGLAILSAAEAAGVRVGCGPRHRPWSRRPARARTDRDRPHRGDHRWRRRGAVARHGALAPQPRLLLSRRRRSRARSRTLLHRRTRRRFLGR